MAIQGKPNPSAAFDFMRITGREEGLSPLLVQGSFKLAARKKSVDKSLFPTCDFFILGELTNFFLTKAQPQMAKLQGTPQEGPTSGWPKQGVDIRSIHR